MTHDADDCEQFAVMGHHWRLGFKLISGMVWLHSMDPPKSMLVAVSPFILTFSVDVTVQPDPADPAGRVCRVVLGPGVKYVDVDTIFEVAVCVVVVVGSTAAKVAPPATNRKLVIHANTHINLRIQIILSALQ